MRNGTTLLGTQVLASGGLDGGGYVTGINIANDGWKVSRNDTRTANIRGPSATTWDLAFRYGDNIAVSESVYTGPSQWCYDICLAPTDSTNVWAVAYGYLYKSVDRCVTWTRNAAYFTSKSSTPNSPGAYDPSQGFVANPNHRYGGQHVRVDPFDKTIVGVGDAVDGLYYTINGGTNWTLHTTIPAPINVSTDRRGINIAYDVSTIATGKAQTVVVGVPGRGIYRSTTGINGAMSIVNATGAPPNGYSTSIEAAGSKIFVCGDGTNNDTQVYVYNGTAWSAPAGITGVCVRAKPGTPLTVIVMTAGGGMHSSTDGGATWTSYLLASSNYNCVDVPWLAVTNSAYMSTGQFEWDPTLNRIHIACGSGTFYFDSPPRTLVSQLYQSTTLGIKQMLIMDAVVTPTGKVLMPCQDRPLFLFSRPGTKVQAASHAPNYTDPIRQGNGVDYAANDENYIVMTYQRGGNTTNTIMISTDGGSSWNAPSGTVPTFNASLISGGNVAVGNKLNFVWCPTSDGPMYYTTDGGATFLTPTFGASVSMTGAIWHHAYNVRRRILWADKATPGRFLAFCVGIDGTNSAADIACRGLWESTNSGANWTKVRASFFEGFNTDYYSCKLRPVPGYANQLFWARGSLAQYPAAPVVNGLYFSTDKGATITTMPGFAGVEDIAFGKPDVGKTYPRLMVLGYRTPVATLTRGAWESNDFDPANPTAATWALRTNAPGGRMEEDGILVGDMSFYGRFYHVINGGGFYVDDYSYSMAVT